MMPAGRVRIVVADDHATFRDGLKRLIEICSGPPMATRSIMRTGAHNHRGDTIAALELGARGIVLKTSEAVMLFRSIRAVMHGEYWLWHQSVPDGSEAIRRVMASGDAARDIAQLRSVREDTVKRSSKWSFGGVAVTTLVEDRKNCRSRVGRGFQPRLGDPEKGRPTSIARSIDARNDKSPSRGIFSGLGGDPVSLRTLNAFLARRRRPDSTIESFGVLIATARHT